MFTGLVTDMGRVTSIEDANGIRRVRVESRYPASSIQMGASIEHSGVCLTVVEFGATPKGGSWWTVEAIPETLSRTTLGSWKVGGEVNLELSLKLGDELGGHLVYGHVDGLGRVRSVTPDGDSRRIRIEIAEPLAKFLAEKGSITVDGISLTSWDCRGARFSVAVVPHTLAHTTLGQARPGALINLEQDVISRWVERLLPGR